MRPIGPNLVCFHGWARRPTMLLIGLLIAWLPFPQANVSLGDEKDGKKRSTTVSRSKMEGWIRDLQATAYQQRQQAFLEIWQAGPEVDALLEEQAKSPNAIAATTSKWLLLLRKLGKTPNDASESLTNLSLVHAGDFHTLLRLAKNEEWGQVLMILELLNGEQRERIVEDSTNRETLISLALEGDQSIVVPMLVDRLYPSVQARAARKLWRDIGANLEEDSPASIKDPTTQVFELEWDGKVREAIDLAKQNKNPLLADFVRQRHFLWSELSRENAKLPKASEVRHVDQLHDATLQALYARWSQRSEMAEDWRNLLAQVPSKSIDPYELGSALVAIGEFKEGLRLLETVSPMNAFHCYQYLGDVDAMFRLGGIEDVSKLDAKQWLESRSASLKTGLGISTQEFAITAELSSLLHRLGRIEDSKVIDDALMRFAEINSTISNMELLKAWVDNGRRDRAIQAIADFLDKHASSRNFERENAGDLESMLEVVFDEFSLLSRGLLTEIKSRYPKLSWAECLEQLEQFHHGVMPDRWKSPRDFESLIWKVFDASSFDESRQASVAYVLSNLSKDLGYLPLSELLLYRAPPSLTTATLRLEALAARGAFDTALQRSEELRQRRPADLRLQLLRASWLDQVGLKDEAAQAKQRSLSIPLEPDSYAFLHASLKEAGFEEDANRLLEFAWSTVDTSEQRLGLLAQTLLKVVEANDPKRAANLARVWQAQAIRGGRRNSIQSAQQIFFQMKEFSNEAMYWVEKGNWEEADLWVKRAFSLRPDDIDVPIRIVPKAVKQFGEEVAERWFRPYFDHHKKHLERWPMDAMYHNNLAWLAAKCEREISEALMHAERANALRPNDPTYLDTLAEVEFCRKNYSRAIELEIACRRIDGKDSHNKEQLARFRAAQQATKNGNDR